MQKLLINAVHESCLADHPFLRSVKARLVNHDGTDQQGVMVPSPSDTQFQDALAGLSAIQSGQYSP